MFGSDLLGEWLNVSGVYRYDLRAMLFSYAGLAAMIGIGLFLRHRQSISAVIGISALGSVAFFLLSNFGSWLDPLMKYDRSLAGLVECYAMALPFFRHTFASDILFAVVFVMALPVVGHGATSIRIGDD